MKAQQNGTGAFQKFGECLYRYSNGVYYARIRVEGKEIKCSTRKDRSGASSLNRSHSLRRAKRMSGSHPTCTKAAGRAISD